MLTYFVIIVWFIKVDTYNYIPTYCKITMLWFQSSWLIFLGNCLTFTITLIKICMCFFLHIRSYSKCGNIYVGINYMSEWIGSTINVCIKLKSVKNVQFWEAAMFMSRNKFELLLFCLENKYFTLWRKQ